MRHGVHVAGRQHERTVDRGTLGLMDGDRVSMADMGMDGGVDPDDARWAAVNGDGDDAIRDINDGAGRAVFHGETAVVLAE
jgi:hypothetical protein